MQVDIARLEATMLTEFRALHKRVTAESRANQTAIDKLDVKVDRINGSIAAVKERTGVLEAKILTLSESLTNTRKRLHELAGQLMEWFTRSGHDSLAKRVSMTGDDALWTWKDTRWMIYLLGLGAGALWAILQATGKL